jgi:type II secretory pathway component PulK
VAIAAVIVSATQLLTWRTAVLGRTSIARVQARWSARAGIEQVIATLAFNTTTPDLEDPMTLIRDLEYDWAGELDTGSWDIRHVSEGEEFRGPLDEHSRLNLSTITAIQFAEFENMGLDTIDAINDWVDEDDEVQSLGAEESFYLGRNMGYTPRNANFKSVAELELVAGAFAEYVRGEDWNLNNRLDPNEDDGEDSVPPDDGDGKLRGGWGSLLSTRSRTSPLSHSGFPRINLRDTTPEELIEATEISSLQADALIEWAQTSEANLGTLLIVDLPVLASGGSSSTDRRTTGRTSRSSLSAEEPAPLSKEQLKNIFSETTLDDFTGQEPVPGKVNLNTAGPEVLRILFGGDSAIAESVMALRQSRSEGITSVVDLLDIRRIAPEEVAAMAAYLDVRSYVFSVTSRGIAKTGQEVEIYAILDRSTLPVKIVEYREK